MEKEFVIEDGVLNSYAGKGGEVNIPEGVTCIASNAFKNIKNFERIVLPKTVEAIERYAFYRCEHIGKVVITGNPKIADRAFADSGVGEYLVVDSTKYISEDGVVYNAKKTKLILFPAHKNIAEYRIPEGVTSVAPYVLNGTNIYVLIVYLPRSLQKIPKNAFSFHGNDRPVEDYEKYKNYVQWAWESEFNDRVCWLNGHVAFYNPELINELGGGIYLGGPIDDLPGKFKRYAAYGFLYALQVGIKEIEPYKMGYFEYIKKNESRYISVGNDFTFNLMLQEKLISSKAVSELINHPYVKATPEIMTAVLDYQKMISEGTGLSRLSLSEDDAEMKRRIKMEKRRGEIKNQRGIKGIAFVATGDMKNFGWQDEYTGAKDWSDLQEYIEARGGYLRSTVSSKTDYVICNDPNLQTSKMKKALELGITVISEEEFMNMAKESAIITVGDSDFEIKGKTLKKYKGSNKVVVIPDGVKKINWSAFDKDSGVEEVTVPEGVTEICEDAFFHCSSLRKVVMPDGLQKIGDRAFWMCEKLEEAIIPSSVLNIGTEAFYECKGLRKVYIADTVQKIIKHAFFGQYDNEEEDWFVRDWEIEIDCIANSETNQKQLLYALRFENLAYTYLWNKLTASDSVVSQIKGWLGNKSKRKVIAGAAIRKNNVQIIENLLKQDIKISKKEIEEYIAEAKDAGNLEMADYLAEYTK